MPKSTGPFGKGVTELDAYSADNTLSVAGIKEQDEASKAELQQMIIDDAERIAALYGEQVGEAEGWLADYLVTSKAATIAGMDVQRQNAARAMQASIGGGLDRGLTGAGAQRAESAAERAGTAEAAYITGRGEEIDKTAYDKRVDILNLEAQAAEQALVATKVKYDAPTKTEQLEIKYAKYDAAWARSKAANKGSNFLMNDDEEGAFAMMLAEIRDEPDQQVKDKYLRKMCAVIDSGDTGASLCESKGFDMDTVNY